MHHLFNGSFVQRLRQIQWYEHRYERFAGTRSFPCVNFSKPPSLILKAKESIGQLIGQLFAKIIEVLFLCVFDVMYSGEYDVSGVTLSVCIHTGQAEKFT